MGIGETLDRLFTIRIVPQEWDKHVYAYSGAIVGAAVFVYTRRWSIAILWDLLAVFSTWGTCKMAGPLGDYVVRTLHFLWG